MSEVKKTSLTIPQLNKRRNNPNITEEEYKALTEKINILKRKLKKKGKKGGPPNVKPQKIKIGKLNKQLGGATKKGAGGSGGAATNHAAGALTYSGIAGKIAAARDSNPAKWDKLQNSDNVNKMELATKMIAFDEKREMREKYKEERNIKQAKLQSARRAEAKRQSDIIEADREAEAKRKADEKEEKRKLKVQEVLDKEVAKYSKRQGVIDKKIQEVSDEVAQFKYLENLKKIANEQIEINQVKLDTKKGELEKAKKDATTAKALDQTNKEHRRIFKQATARATKLHEDVAKLEKRSEDKLVQSSREIAYLENQKKLITDRRKQWDKEITDMEKKQKSSKELIEQKQQLLDNRKQHEKEFKERQVPIDTTEKEYKDKLAANRVEKKVAAEEKKDAKAIIKEQNDKDKLTKDEAKLKKEKDKLAAEKLKDVNRVEFNKRRNDLLDEQKAFEKEKSEHDAAVKITEDALTSKKEELRVKRQEKTQTDKEGREIKKDAKFIEKHDNEVKKLKKETTKLTKDRTRQTKVQENLDEKKTLLDENIRIANDYKTKQDELDIKKRALDDVETKLKIEKKTKSELKRDNNVNKRNEKEAKSHNDYVKSLNTQAKKMREDYDTAQNKQINKGNKLKLKMELDAQKKEIEVLMGGLLNDQRQIKLWYTERKNVLEREKAEHKRMESISKQNTEWNDIGLKRDAALIELKAKFDEKKNKLDNDIILMQKKEAAYEEVYRETERARKLEAANEQVKRQTQANLKLQNKANRKAEKEESNKTIQGYKDAATKKITTDRENAKKENETKKKQQKIEKEEAREKEIKQKNLEGDALHAWNIMQSEAEEEHKQNKRIQKAGEDDERKIERKKQSDESRDEIKKEEKRLKKLRNEATEKSLKEYKEGREKLENDKKIVAEEEAKREHKDKLAEDRKKKITDFQKKKAERDEAHKDKMERNEDKFISNIVVSEYTKEEKEKQNKEHKRQEELNKNSQTNIKEQNRQKNIAERKQQQQDKFDETLAEKELNEYNKLDKQIENYQDRRSTRLNNENKKKESNERVEQAKKEQRDFIEGGVYDMLVTNMGFTPPQPKEEIVVDEVQSGHGKKRARDESPTTKMRNLKPGKEIDKNISTLNHNDAFSRNYNQLQQYSNQFNDNITIYDQTNTDNFDFDSQEARDAADRADELSLLEAGEGSKMKSNDTEGQNVDEMLGIDPELFTTTATTTTST